jgi:hypothetical protein
MRRRAGKVWVVLLVAAAALAPAARGAPARYRRGTRHYNVETTISNEFTRLVADHMESIYQEYVRRLGDLVGAGGTKKMHVVVFRTEEEYVGYMGQGVKGSAGVFMPGKEVLAGYLGDRPPQALFRILYHEGFHQFVWNHISRQCPIWLNEGMAEYFSEATWTGKGFRVGEVAPGRLMVLRRALAEGRHVPIGRLVTMTPAEWGSDVRGGTAALNYSEAWSLVHFFVHAAEGRYRARFVEYVRQIDKERGAEEAWERCWGGDTAGLEAAWKRYVEALEVTPKYECMMHVQGMLVLLGSLVEKGERPADERALAEVLSKGRWEVTMVGGLYTWASEGERGWQDLMHCPVDRRSRVSYRLRWTEDRLPEIYCFHHRGVVILGRLVRDRATGRLKPEVLESVRAKSSERYLKAYLRGEQ